MKPFSAVQRMHPPGKDREETFTEDVLVLEFVFNSNRQEVHAVIIRLDGTLDHIPIGWLDPLDPAAVIALAKEALA